MCPSIMKPKMDILGRCLVCNFFVSFLYHGCCCSREITKQRTSFTKTMCERRALEKEYSEDDDTGENCDTQDIFYIVMLQRSSKWDY